MPLRYTSDGGLEAFATRLERGAEAAPTALVEALAEGAVKVLDAEFASQSNPSGSPWAARVPPTGSWPILHKTGRMEGSRDVTIGTGFVSIAYDTPAEFHQRGTSRMVARKILPGGEATARWMEALDDAAARKLQELFGGSL
jgi:hypothetical protein